MGKQDAGWCEFTSKKMILLISELDHFYSVTTLWTGERVSQLSHAVKTTTVKQQTSLSSHYVKGASLGDERNITPHV